MSKKIKLKLTNHIIITKNQTNEKTVQTMNVWRRQSSLQGN